jgi:hypothetical protein
LLQTPEDIRRQMSDVRNGNVECAALTPET